MNQTLLIIGVVLLIIGIIALQLKWDIMPSVIKDNVRYILIIGFLIVGYSLAGFMGLIAGAVLSAIMVLGGGV